MSNPSVTAAASSGKEIRLFLSDDFPGMRHATLSTWSGQAFVCPKRLFPRLSEWKATQRPGVYILLGFDGRASSVIYIGHGENVQERLMAHRYREQPILSEITHALFFTGQADELNQDQIAYLETKLIERAKHVLGRNSVYSSYDLKPHEKPQTHSTVPALEEVLSCIYTMAEALGFDVFKLREPWKHGASDKFIFKAYEAIGYPVGEKEFVVEAGSGAALEDTDLKEYGVKKNLKDNGVLIAEGGRLKFTKDHTFRSASEAASVVAGCGRNGLRFWVRMSDCKSLDCVEEEAEELDQIARMASKVTGVKIHEDSPRTVAFLRQLKVRKKRLEIILARTANDSGLRKLYTESYKAVRLSRDTAIIIRSLRSVAPRMNPVFEKILADGCFSAEELESNPCALVKEKGRAIAEANLHARAVLAACVRSAQEIQEGSLPQNGPKYWMLALAALGVD